MSATSPVGDPFGGANGITSPQNHVIPTPGWGMGRCRKCGKLLGTHEYHLCPVDQHTYPWQPYAPYVPYPPPAPPVKTTTTTTFSPRKKQRPDGEAMRADDV